MERFAFALVVVISVVGVACGPSIEPPPPCLEGRVCTREEGDTLRLTIVNATESGTQVGYSFVDQAEVDLDAAWHLSFERYIIRSNGGASGDLGVSVAIVEDVLENVSAPPSDGAFQQDVEGTSGFRDDPRTVFLDDDPWYDYDLLTHTLAPKARTYVVKTPETTVALQIVAYYDEDNEAGHPAFRWKPL